ncbi:MAG TPA: zinc ribbon domain-containing protein [Gammaproteobacteria bacterium]|nr:zinc ribbon domain-containing protein [Gammaproteobacteria bacterium]
MPFYEYECQACGKYLETLQKISEPPLTDCPECGRPELKKLVSAAGFRLKGGGWYETDFKGKDKKKNLHDGAGDKTGGDKSAGDKGGAAKPDTAAKTDKSSVEKPAPKSKASTDD